MVDRVHFSKVGDSVVIRGAHCSLGPRESVPGSLEINGEGTISFLRETPAEIGDRHTEIDLEGFLVMPGLINAHDHLQFALYPRLGNPPYRNYIDWGEDIHRTSSEIIERHRSVPKEVRLWWGGIRNLLCGVTTVCHHDPLWPELQRSDFPVRVVQRYGWAHSFAFGGDIRHARSVTPEGSVFIMHVCEGDDEQAGEEIFALDRLGLLDAGTVLVHGLAMDEAGAALMRKRGAALIVCPSSNKFLFGRLPDMGVLGAVESVALGSDSPMTAEGDLLDEVRFAIHCCGIPPDVAYRMVTETPAAILKLGNAGGSLIGNRMGDLLAVRETGQNPADRLRTLCMTDVELVMVGGRVQLASEKILDRLPLQMKKGLEPLSIDGMIRWLRAPVDQLLRRSEEALGAGQVRMGSRVIRNPDLADIQGK